MWRLHYSFMVLMEPELNLVNFTKEVHVYFICPCFSQHIFLFHPSSLPRVLISALPRTISPISAESP